MSLFEKLQKIAENLQNVYVAGCMDALAELNKKADKENDWTKEPIITVTCDGTQHTYNFTDLNLDAMILVFESTTAEKTQAGRVIFNGRNNTDLYFANYLNTGGARCTMAYVDLKRKFAVRGVSVDKSGISLQTDTVFTEAMLKGQVEVINTILFQSFASVIIPNGSIIKIYGREKV